MLESWNQMKAGDSCPRQTSCMGNIIQSHWGVHSIPKGHPWTGASTHHQAKNPHWVPYWDETNSKCPVNLLNFWFSCSYLWNTYFKKRSGLILAFVYKLPKYKPQLLSHVDDRCFWRSARHRHLRSLPIQAFLSSLPPLAPHPQPASELGIWMDEGQYVKQGGSSPSASDPCPHTLPLL